MNAEEKKIDEELKRYRNNDPVVIKEMNNMVDECVNAINRWTDNTYNCKSYVVKHFGRSSGEVDKMIDIPEDFDYIERK